MMKFKMKSVASLAVAGVLFLAGCGSDSATSDANSEGAEASHSIRLASNHPDEHPVTPSLRAFASQVGEATDNTVNIEVAANGLLGGERDVIELVKSGAVEMAKVSASALEGFDESYAIFSLAICIPKPRTLL